MISSPPIARRTATLVSADTAGCSRRGTWTATDPTKLPLTGGATPGDSINVIWQDPS